MFRYGFGKRLVDLGVDYGWHVLAAVSGGVDSMCMLDALVHCNMDLKVSVAHVNFNLRGQESNMDTIMVEKWCAQHNVPLFKESFNTKEFAAQKGISIEMAARELRYNWFFSLMKEHEFNCLAIAHNANDNAETLMLNLTRGCGIYGTGGIREKVLLSPEENGQYIIRPLMAYTRKEIEKYAERHNVPFRTDSTNLLSDFSRNRIRNEVFPQLEKINPSVIETFNRNIRHFRQAGSILQKHIEVKLGELCNTFTLFEEFEKSRFANRLCGLNLLHNLIAVEENGETINFSCIVCIVELDVLLQEEEWEFWIYRIADRYAFSPAIIEDICRSIADDGGPKKFLSGNGEFIAVKERGLLKIYLNVAEGKELEIETSLITREAWRTRKDASQLCPTLYMDASAIQMPLSCRPVAPGDRFSPLGLKGSKKVTDYLTDIKFENLHKGNVTVMLDATNTIVCIPGLQISNKARVTSSTAEIIQIEIR